MFVRFLCLVFNDNRYILGDEINILAYFHKDIKGQWNRIKLIESMKSLKLMKSIESVELIGLIGVIESNQVNKNLLHVHVFSHNFNSIFIEGLRTKLSIFYYCVLGEEVGGNRTRKSRGSLCIKHRDSFLNKFSMLRDSMQR